MAALMQYGITNGTDAVYFVGNKAGFQLNGAPQTFPAFKDGGIYSSSPFSAGRRLVLAQYDDIDDVLSLQINGECPDYIDRDIQTLARLLVQATDFWLSPWAHDPVYIIRQGGKETNVSYAILKEWNIPQVGDPFTEPFHSLRSAAVLEDFSLGLRHGLWLENPPGTGTLIFGGYTTTQEGRVVGRLETGAREYFVSNGYANRNITHMYRYELGGWSANLIGSALPQIIINNSQVTGDGLYIGSTEQPFNNVVFDLGPASSCNGSWQYWNGAAWTNIPNVKNNTNADGFIPAGSPFDTVGVNAVSFQQPSNWAMVVNVVNAWWIRFLINEDFPVITRQRNRDIYTCKWNWFDVESDQLPGDIPALIRTGLYQENVDGEVNRIVVGTRSLSRGNLGLYMPITSMAGSGALSVTDATTPSGTCIQQAPAGAGTDLYGGRIQEATFSNLVDGEYHVFGIHKQLSGTIGDFDVWIEMRDYDLGASFFFVSDKIPTKVLGVWHAFDYGTVQIGPPLDVDYPTAYGAYRRVDLYVRCDYAPAAGASSLNTYAIVFIPVDEWVGDFIDPHFQESAQAPLAEKAVLELDSVSSVKREIFSVMREHEDVGGGAILTRYRENAAGPLVLQANSNQRVHVFCMKYRTAEDCWQVYFDALHTIRPYRNARYLGYRGDR